MRAPVDNRSLQDIVTEIHGRPVYGLPLAPRGWRDGLGLLYDLRMGPSEREAVLRYAVHAATAERTRPAEESVERALWEWAEETAAAQGLSRIFRNNLVTERLARIRARGAQVPVSATAAPRTRSEVQLEIIPRGWEPGRYDWRVCVVSADGEVDCVQEDFHGTVFADLPARLAESLTEAFRRCDEPGCTAALQLAVPGALVAFAADTWQLHPGDRPLGVDRPIVVRRSDAPPDEDPAVTVERQDRWRAQHSGHITPLVLDGEASGGDLPSERELRALPYDTVPVLCRSGPTAPEALHRLAHSGHPVALWHRGQQEAAQSTDYLRGVQHMARAVHTAAGLPAALAELRSYVANGVPEAYWSIGLMLLYDDPTRPLPGLDNLL